MTDEARDAARAPDAEPRAPAAMAQAEPREARGLHARVAQEEEGDGDAMMFNPWVLLVWVWLCGAHAMWLIARDQDTTGTFLAHPKMNTALVVAGWPFFVTAAWCSMGYDLLTGWPKRKQERTG